ncbi:putative het domain [Phaeomoniella chlamydospora]|uniref:Putative het domain n=1 Tax=Phaeomoniella chlamydospora TaxID=158046 RepID=A0A0G2GKT3_PHACM|nr:putative het domain [Phaeomoniella chlamydospora]
MDHLDRPKAAVFPQFKIPYVCMSLYGGKDFMSYPSTQGYDIEKAKACDFVRTSGKDEDTKYIYDDLPALQSFLQSWLFFGLLHELHSMVGLIFEPSDFISTDTFVTTTVGEKLGTIRRLDTSGLHNLLVIWYEYSQTLDHAEVEKECRHFDECLEAVYKLCYRLVRCSSYIDEKLVLSFMSLGNTLENGMRWVHDRSYYDRLPEGGSTVHGLVPPWRPGHRGWDAPPMLFQKLLYNGWCPSEINILRRDFEINEIIYASQMPRFGDRNKHLACNPDHCNAANIDDATYQTQHHPQCKDFDQCPELAVDYDLVCNILQAGETPLIMATQTGDSLSLNVVPSTIPNGPFAGQKLSYICFSHVWAHGLGNSKRNALPSCQMQALHRYTYPILGIRARQSDVRISFFWIDTLCVPVQPEHAHLRKKAIAAMADVYSQARHVLVIDEALARTSLKRFEEDLMSREVGATLAASASVINQKELTFAIILSDWWRRLWTLQEGLLTNSLLVLFREGAMSMQEVVSSTNEDHVRNRADMSSEALKVALHNLIDRAWPFGHTSHHRKVITLLCDRSTSHAADEPSCLATLMNVDVSKILGTPKESRMRQFYLSLDTIPAGLLFLPGPKLDFPGFRWAPRSLMGEGGPSKRYVYSIMAEEEDSEAKISEHGLKLEATGYLLTSFNVALNHNCYIVPGPPGKLPSTHFEPNHAPPYDVTAIIHNADDYAVPKWNELGHQNKIDPVLIFPAHRKLGVAQQNPAILAHSPRKLDGAEKEGDATWTATYLCAVHCFTNSMAMWSGDCTAKSRILTEQRSIDSGRGYTGDVVWFKDGGKPIRRWMIT